MKKLLKTGFVLASIAFILLFSFYLYAYFSPIPLLGQSSRIRLYDQNQVKYYESNFSKSSEWINYNQIPKVVIEAITSVEDRRFFSHFGLDPVRIVRAFLDNMKNKDIVAGGSTITQQYARNLFLSFEQTYTRKIKEAIMATKMEMHFSKQQILEGYLNTIYFGHGIYGIAKASDFFFGKKLDECNLAEVALLVGIPNGPALFSPFISMEQAKKRQNVVLNAMVANDAISDTQKQRAINTPLFLTAPPSEKKSGESGYYRDAVISELKALGLYDEKHLEKGLEVYTYYDPEAQSALQKSITKHLPIDSEQEVAGIIVEPFTFQVLAINGGKDYTLSQYNRALSSQRQIGSTLKPLLYYLALEEGFTPSSRFKSEATSFSISSTETYAPTNYKNIYPNAEISMINAMGVSDNIFAVKTHLFLGKEMLLNALEAFDIHQLEATASMALGATNFPLIDLAKIYTTFASEGLMDTPQFINLVKDGDGKVLYQREQKVTQLLKRDDTLILTQLLRAPFDIKNMTNMTPSLLGYEPFATISAKSGSSDWDSLIAGYNPAYCVVLWSGYDENKKLVSNNERKIPKDIFREIFNTFYPQGTNYPWYQLSPQLEERKVNPINGEISENGSIYWYKKEPVNQDQNVILP